MKLRRIPYLWWIFLLIMVLAFLGIYFFMPGASKLPNDFLLARQDAAQVSQKIVDLTTDTNNKIKAVNVLDFKGDADQALGLIRDARQTNSEAYYQASALAIYLQRLAASLSNVRSREAQQIAYEAVAIELSLVSEFIVYTQKLNSFLDGLARAIATDSFSERQAINQYLLSVNEQANKINSLNKEFFSKMKELDEAF